MLTRAYSIVDLKSVDDEQRVIRGIASTPSVDRVGDIVEPLGARAAADIPLFLYHDSSQTVGRARLGKATSNGIPFEASIPQVKETGRLKDRVDEAWQMLKYRLITGVSIGFKPLADAVERMKDGGLRFKEFEILELSLVPVPANEQATITSIKSIDRQALRAASGESQGKAVALVCPGVTGTTPTHTPKGQTVKTISEQIKDLESTRAAKAARMSEVMKKSLDEGRSTNEAEGQEFDELDSQIKQIDGDLVRLRKMEKMNIEQAVVVAAPTTKAASDSRAGAVTVKSNEPKGSAFTRFAIAKMLGKGDTMASIETARQRWPDNPEVETMLKAAVAAGTTTDATWGGPLAVLQPLAGEFVELLRPATIIGKIPNLRKVPFNVSVPKQTAGGTYGWVGQGAAKPLTAAAFATVSLTMAKAAGIIVLTEELIKTSTPSAEDTIRQEMIAGIAQFLDGQFITPGVAATSANPASITNGTTPITTAGTTPDNARTDIKALIAAFVAANQTTANAVLIMSEANAFALGSAQNPLGQPIYPGLGTNGGSILGIPVVTSQTAGANVVLVDARGILFADEGGVNVDVSREASLQMDSAPDNPTAATTVMVSLWQRNLVGLRAERYINWVRALDTSVKYVVATYA